MAHVRFTDGRGNHVATAYDTRYREAISAAILKREEEIHREETIIEKLNQTAGTLNALFGSENFHVTVRLTRGEFVHLSKRPEFISHATGLAEPASGSFCGVRVYFSDAEEEENRGR